MANKTSRNSYNRAPSNKTAGSGSNNRSKGKKAYQQKKKTLGFDLTDTESKIAFYVFIVMAVLLSALLIAGFALGFSRCGTPEVPEEEPESAAPAITQKEYADIDDIIDLFENPVLSENEYNYDNDTFKFSYDADTLNLTDRFEEADTVSLTAGSGKNSGLTVTYMPGMSDVDPIDYIDKYVNLMCERYSDYSITPEQATNAEFNGTKTSQREFTVYLPEYPVRIITKISVKGDNAYVAQMTLGGEQSGNEIRALIDTYYSIQFSDSESRRTYA